MELKTIPNSNLIEHNGFENLHLVGGDKLKIIKDSPDGPAEEILKFVVVANRTADVILSVHINEHKS